MLVSVPGLSCVLVRLQCLGSGWQQSQPTESGHFVRDSLHTHHQNQKVKACSASQEIVVSVDVAPRLGTHAITKTLNGLLAGSVAYQIIAI